MRNRTAREVDTMAAKTKINRRGLFWLSGIMIVAALAIALTTAGAFARIATGTAAGGAAPSAPVSEGTNGGPARINRPNGVPTDTDTPTETPTDTETPLPPTPTPQFDAFALLQPGIAGNCPPPPNGG